MGFASGLRRTLKRKDQQWPCAEHTPADQISILLLSSPQWPQFSSAQPQLKTSRRIHVLASCNSHTCRISMHRQEGDEPWLINQHTDAAHAHDKDPVRLSSPSAANTTTDRETGIDRKLEQRPMQERVTASQASSPFHRLPPKGSIPFVWLTLTYNPYLNRFHCRHRTCNHRRSRRGGC